MDPLTDVDGLKWFYYDIAGRLVSTTLAKPTATDTNPTYYYFYDNYGNQVGIQDAMDRLTVFQYNELNQQTAKYMPYAFTDPTGGEITVDDIYNTLDSASPDAEYWVYDDLGRLEGHTDYEGHLRLLSYNDRGQLEFDSSYASVDDYDSENPTYNANPEISYTYDNLGRKLSETVTEYDSGGTGNEVYYCDYYYDNEGRIDYLDAASGSIGYSYNDITGRQVSVYTPASGTLISKVDYGYDALGRLATVTCDLRNSVDVDEITAYTYDENGSLKSTLYPNGNYAEYDYDALNRLTSLTNWATSQKLSVRSSFAYTLYASGRRASVTESDGTTIDWTYDNLDRLLTETYDAPGTSDDYVHGYHYDLIGNRIRLDIDGTPGTYYFYNDVDQLEKETSDSDGLNILVGYQYDDNGSLTQKTVTGGSTSTYQYDFQNRLASVDDGTTVVYYWYDPDGVRVEKQIAGGQTTDYLIDPANQTGYPQVFTETSGSTQTSYSIGSEIISQAVGTADPQYLLRDGHSSVRQISDPSGVITSHYHFDAYGQLLSRSDTPATNILYVGQMLDTNLGFYNNWHRWYDPSNGRFNRLDDYPGDNYDPPSLHKYLYCQADPLNGIDPTGQFYLSEINVTAAIQSVLITMNAAGAIYHAKNLVASTVNVYNAWSDGDFWGSLPDVVMGVVHGTGLAFNIAGMIGSITPPPAAQMPALALSGGGTLVAERFWTVVVSNPQLAGWVIKRVAPPAFSAYMALTSRSSRGSVEIHHKAPYGNKEYDFQNHPLVKKSGVDLKKDPRNQMLLGNHRGRHSSAYLKAIKKLLDEANKTIRGKQNAIEVLNNIYVEIENLIADGTLQPYVNKDVYVP